MPLYHFTDPRNIPSIRENGLLSWQQLKIRGITHFPASNDLSRNLDAAKNLQNYVRLCLQQQHPMATMALFEGRIGNLVWLVIDDAVLQLQTTLFSNRNAAANAAIINRDPHTALGSNDQQAEVLVAESIEPRWIIFPSESQKNTNALYDDVPF